MSAIAQPWNRGSTLVCQAPNYHPVHQYAVQNAAYGHSLDPWARVPGHSQTVQPQFLYFNDNPTDYAVHELSILTGTRLDLNVAASLKPSAPSPTKSVNINPFPETVPLFEMVEYPTADKNLVPPCKPSEHDSLDMIATSLVKLTTDKNTKTIITYLNNAFRDESTVPRKSRRSGRGNGPGARKQESVKTQRRLEASTGNGDHRHMPRCEVLTNAKLAEHPLKKDAPILTSNTKGNHFIVIEERSDGMCNLGEVNCGILVSKGWISKNELRVYTAAEEAEILIPEAIEECFDIIEELNSTKMAPTLLWSDEDDNKMNDHEFVMLPLPLLG